MQGKSRVLSRLPLYNRAAWQGCLYTLRPWFLLLYRSNNFPYFQYVAFMSLFMERRSFPNWSHNSIFDLRICACARESHTLIRALVIHLSHDMVSSKPMNQMWFITITAEAARPEFFPQQVSPRTLLDGAALYNKGYRTKIGSHGTNCTVSIDTKPMVSNGVTPYTKSAYALGIESTWIHRYTPMRSAGNVHGWPYGPQNN